MALVLWDKALVLWEQPHNECQGSNYEFCVKQGYPQRAASGGGDSISLGGANDNLTTGRGTSHESYFRFAMNGAVFRVMILCKDKQNVLKNTSYDFLLIAMQVICMTTFTPSFDIFQVIFFHQCRW